MAFNNRSSNNSDWVSQNSGRGRIDRTKGGISTSSNALQGAGQEFVHRTNSNNGRSQQATPHSIHQFGGNIPQVGTDLSLVSSPGLFSAQQQYQGMNKMQTPSGYRQFSGGLS